MRGVYVFCSFGRFFYSLYFIDMEANLEHIRKIVRFHSDVEWWADVKAE
jgi:hypothetical protein